MKKLVVFVLIITLGMIHLHNRPIYGASGFPELPCGYGINRVDPESYMGVFGLFFPKLAPRLSEPKIYADYDIWFRGWLHNCILHEPQPLAAINHISWSLRTSTDFPTERDLAFFSGMWVMSTDKKRVPWNFHKIAEARCLYPALPDSVGIIALSGESFSNSIALAVLLKRLDMFGAYVVLPYDPGMYSSDPKPPQIIEWCVGKIVLFK